ncbi:MAG: Ig-like domain-containing protein [Chloroflexota bacterium]
MTLMLGLSVLLFLQAVGSVQAATIVVTNTNDSGPGSLRDAILAAAAGDTITFDVTGTITLTSGQLTVDKSLTLDGPGADLLTIDANGSSRVFSVTNGATLEVRLLTLTGGAATSGGGALVSDSKLVLRNSVVTGNTASLFGGGMNVAGSSASAVVHDSVIEDNTSLFFGGGIFAASGSAVEIQNSLIANNSAVEDNGGGIFANDATFTVINSTFFDNSAGNRGGHLFNSAGTTTLRHVTLSAGTAPLGGAAVDSFGPNAQTVLQNTLFFANDSSECLGNTSGITINGVSLSDQTNACANGTATSVATALADNGGPNQTLALLTGSSAIDAGAADFCPLLDQRGAARDAACDAGAYEFTAAAPTVSFSFAPTVLEGDQVTVTVTATNISPGESVIVPLFFSGTATRGQDYTIDGLPNDTITFNSGGQSEFVITAADDDEKDSGETVVITLALLGTAGIGSPNPQTLAINELTGTDGTINIPPASIVVGEPVPVTVSDEDRSGLGSVQVTVTNMATGDSETLTLTETGPGVFSGQLATAFGTAPDGAANGQINVKPNDIVTATYFDEFTASGPPTDRMDSTVVRNAAPTTSGIPDVTVAEDSPPQFIDLTLYFDDIDDDALTYAVTSNTNPGLLVTSVDNTTGTLLLGFTSNGNGSGQVTVQATDSGGLSVSDTFNVTVTPVNDGPMLNMVGNRTVAAGAVVNIPLSAVDIDSADLTFSVSGAPGFVSVANDGAQTATLTIAPPLDSAGTYPGVVISVTDGELGDSETITITITQTNQPPVAIGQSLTTQEDTPLDFSLMGSDPDGGSLIYTVIGGPFNGSIDTSALPAVRYTPNPNYNGPDEITFKVSDGALESDPATVSITVTPVNDPPVLGPIEAIVMTAGQTRTVNLTASDVDGDPLTFLLDGEPGFVSLSGSSITLTPTLADVGSYTMTVSVSDTTAVDQVPVNITVQEPAGPACPIDLTLAGVPTDAITGPLTIEAVVPASAADLIASVTFSAYHVETDVTIPWTENNAPYFFYGDNDGTPNGYDAPRGTLQLTATALTAAGEPCGTAAATIDAGDFIEPVLACPVGFTQVDLFTSMTKLRSTDPQTQSATLSLPVPATPGSLLLVNSRVGHPELGCVDGGPNPDHPWCIQGQTLESFDILVNGDLLANVPDHGEDRFETFTFEAMLADGDELTFAHIAPGAPGRESVSFQAAYCIAEDQAGQ